MGFDEMTDLAFGFLEELVGYWLRWSRHGRNGNYSQRVGLESVAGWMLACEACEVKTRSKCLVWFRDAFQQRHQPNLFYFIYSMLTDVQNLQWIFYLNCDKTDNSKFKKIMVVISKYAVFFHSNVIGITWRYHYDMFIL